jgi:PAS domain S-box-containing protein
MVSVSRKNDAVISVCQNNELNLIEIQGINSAAEALTGYQHSELQGKSLSDILPQSITDIIDSYIEYEEGGKDLASVLGKTRKFQVLSNEGKPISVNLKVFYVVAANKNPRFELLLRDNSFTQQIEALKETLEHDTLPDTVFLIECFKLVSAAVENNLIQANMVLFSIEGYETLSEWMTPEDHASLLYEINNRYHATSRMDDSISYLGEGKIVVLMVGCQPENIDNVIERIRMKITERPIVLASNQSLAITLTANYTPITKNKALSELVSCCDHPL